MPRPGTAGIHSAPPIVDVIGQIMLTPPVLDDEGNETTPAVFADGWHWNIYCATNEAVEALAEFEIAAPTNPRRKLAGT
jgi:hypothetical protein